MHRLTCDMLIRSVEMISFLHFLLIYLNRRFHDQCVKMHITTLSTTPHSSLKYCSSTLVEHDKTNALKLSTKHA